VDADDAVKVIQIDGMSFEIRRTTSSPWRGSSMSDENDHCPVPSTAAEPAADVELWVADGSSVVGDEALVGFTTVVVDDVVAAEEADRRFASSSKQHVSMISSRDRCSRPLG